MPKKKTQIDETEIATRWAFYQCASLSVTNADKRYEFANARSFNIAQTYSFENADAMMQWSNDCVVVAAKIAEKQKAESWSIAATQQHLIEKLPPAMMNVTTVGAYYHKRISRLNVWKKAPYCFVNHDNKIVAYFIGNQAIGKADTYAWQFQQILRRSGAKEDAQRRAYVYARHAAVCYYTLTEQHYSKAWGTFPMQAAFAGENVPDEVLQNVCRLIIQNADGVALPDCWQILHK